MTFLACELAIIVTMFILGDGASLRTQKLLSGLLCVVLFCMLLSGYRYELSRFQDNKSFSETRALGIAINPKHPLGRVIYIGAFSVIILIFYLLLFFWSDGLKHTKITKIVCFKLFLSSGRYTVTILKLFFFINLLRES